MPIVDENDIEILLSFHGQTVVREDGYWWKVEAWRVVPSLSIPHGIPYEFDSCTKLLEDFFQAIDETIVTIENR